MENSGMNYAGNVNAADLATLSLIGRGYGGYGGGIGVGAGSYGDGGNLYAGNSVLAAEAHANGTATGALGKHTLDMISNQGDRFEDQTRAGQFLDARMAISTTRELLSREIADNRVESIRLAGDNRLELANRLADISAANAKCCCETQKLVIEENTKTRELINSRALSEAERELDVCRSKGSSQDTVNAIAMAIQSQTAALAALINDKCDRGRYGVAEAT